MHIKSFQRRSTARNALGKHRAALCDLLEAQTIAANSQGTSITIHRLIHTHSFTCDMVSVCSAVCGVYWYTV